MATYYIQKVKHDSEKVIIGVKTMKNEWKTIEVVESINAGNEFFVLNSSGPKVGVYKEKFIRSYANEQWNDNLDNLPEY